MAHGHEEPAFPFLFWRWKVWLIIWVHPALVFLDFKNYSNTNFISFWFFYLQFVYYPKHLSFFWYHFAETELLFRRKLLITDLRPFFALWKLIPSNLLHLSCSSELISPFLFSPFFKCSLSDVAFYSCFQKQKCSWIFEKYQISPIMTEQTFKFFHK